jgi:Transposase DDE domain
MSRPTRVRYKTTNWPEYNAALRRRGSLTIWLDPQMQWEATPSGRRGRQQIFSDAAIQACLTMKVLFGMALRQATGFVESLLQLIGLDWKVPDFSTLCRRQKTLVVDIASRKSSEPLHLLIDSTGIKVEGEGEWHARKHGGTKRRVWRKIHLAIDERTLEVCAVEVTSSNVGDAPMLSELLARSQRTGRSAPSSPMAPMTRASVMMPSPDVEPMPSSDTQERPTLEARHRRSQGAQRHPARHQTSRSDSVATMERLP